MKVGEAAKELSVCPCVVPRLVKLGKLTARKTSQEGDLVINPESVRDYKRQKRGRKYFR